MKAEDLILFLLGVSGISILISSTKIFAPIRDFFSKRKNKNSIYNFVYQLLNCAICLSVWAGVFMLLMHDHFPEVYRYIALSAGSVSGLYWLLIARRL